MSERDKKLNLSIKSFTEMSKKKKIAFSIIAVSLMVFGSLFAFFYIANVNNQQYHNPEIDLNFGFINNTSITPALIVSGNTGIPPGLYNYNLANITVQVFATMPDFAALGSAIANITISNQENNSAYVELFNYTGNLASKNVHGSLSHMFRTIINEYRTVYRNSPNRNMSISMTIDASYYYVSGTNMYLYRYYNNIPFNPWNQNIIQGTNPHTFIQNVIFNMNQKPIVVSVSKAISMREVGPGGGSTRCVPIWETKAPAIAWGPLPQLIVEDPMNSGYALTASIGTYSGSFSTKIYSAQTTGPEDISGQVTSTEISQSASWGSSSSSFSLTNNNLPSAEPVSGMNISVLALQHVEYQVTVNQLYIEVYSGDTLYSTPTNTKTASFEVLNIDNGTLAYEVGSLQGLYDMNSTWAGKNWATLFNYGLQADKTITIPSGTTVNSVNYTFQSHTFQCATGKAATTGLSNVGMAVTALGVGITIASLVLAPETLGVSLGLLSIGVGLITMELSGIPQIVNTPLYTIGQSQEINDLSFSNAKWTGNTGGSYSGPVNVYTNQYDQTELWQIGSSSYNVYMPSPVITSGQA